MTAPQSPSRIALMKDYFNTDNDGNLLPKAEQLTNTEIIQFKKADADGFGQVADGIADGALTY